MKVGDMIIGDMIKRVRSLRRTSGLVSSPTWKVFEEYTLPVDKQPTGIIIEFGKTCSQVTVLNSEGKIKYWWPKNCEEVK